MNENKSTVGVPSRELAVLSIQEEQKSGFLKDCAPELYRQLFPEDNPGINLDKILCHSNKKLKWRCSGSTCEHLHIWEAIVNNRFLHRGCPFCSGSRICVCRSLARLRPEI